MWMCRLKSSSFEGVVEAHWEIHGSQFYLHRLFKRNPSFPRISGCIQQWELLPSWSLHWFVWHISCLSRSNSMPISPETTVSFLTPTFLNSFRKWKFVPYSQPSPVATPPFWSSNSWALRNLDPWQDYQHLSYAWREPVKPIKTLLPILKSAISWEVSAPSGVFATTSIPSTNFLEE